MTDFVVVIPARYASTRLPAKALREIHGKPMIQHVHERGTESAAREVVIATDDEQIAGVAELFGAIVCMTGDQHQSGTERIAEVADIMDWPDDQVVVNLQGDEPTMPAILIDQCAALLDDATADIATLARRTMRSISVGQRFRTRAMMVATSVRRARRCITMVSTHTAAVCCGSSWRQSRPSSKCASNSNSCERCHLA